MGPYKILGERCLFHESHILVRGQNKARAIVHGLIQTLYCLFLALAFAEAKSAPCPRCLICLCLCPSLSLSIEHCTTTPQRRVRDRRRQAGRTSAIFEKNSPILNQKSKISMEDLAYTNLYIRVYNTNPILRIRQPHCASSHVAEHVQVNRIMETHASDYTWLIATYRASKLRSTWTRQLRVDPWEIPIVLPIAKLQVTWKVLRGKINS